jgi:hypothetical protein
MNVVCPPKFVQEALAQSGPIRVGLAKTLRIAGELGFAELLNHQGIHLEKLSGKVDPATRKPLYSLRLTQAARAMALVDGDYLIFLSIEPDHDKAYR